jgi:hypothetical protein
LPEQNHTASANTDNSRRRLVQTVLATTPVIATLTSRPVQAVQGLSNMLSGNASTCRGDNRYGGMSPGFWKTPNGSTDVYSDSHAVAWQMTGFDYGTRKDGTDGNQWQDYKDGTLYNNVFGANIADPNRSLREVLNQDNGSDQFHLIAGLLNAAYFEAKAGSAAASEYIFTVEQFWALYDHRLDIPDAYSSLRDLIESNYHNSPGTDCGITINGNDL